MKPTMAEVVPSSTDRPNRHVVAGALGRAAPPLVIDLGGDDVPLSQRILRTNGRKSERNMRGFC